MALSGHICYSFTWLSLRALITHTYFHGKLTSMPTAFQCQYTLYYHIRHLEFKYFWFSIGNYEENTGMRNNEVTKRN
jgi:hypothetical protein